MKKGFLFFLLLNAIAGTAQTVPDSLINPVLKARVSGGGAEQQTNDLFILGKVWGFLKYYHPAVASGKYNWDDELIRFLPGYCKVKNRQERSDSLLSWINRLGNVEPCSGCSDRVLKGAKLVPALAWINRDNFSPALAARLQYIRDNRKQGDQYYIKFLTENDINIVQFRHEQDYTRVAFPSAVYGLLALFRFWNTIEYWYPYKYNLPVSWDNVLKQFIPKMILHENASQYMFTVEELVASLHDGHGYVRSTKLQEARGKYYMPVTVKMIDGVCFVTSVLNDSLAALSGIRTGDIIESIDDVPITELVKKTMPYCSASNGPALMNAFSYRLTRTPNKQSVLTVTRNSKAVTITVNNFIPKLFPPIELSPPYFGFQKDSSFCRIGKDIAYVNMLNTNKKDSILLKELVSGAKGLIIDYRKNEDELKGTGANVVIGNMVLPPGKDYVKFTSCQPSYPGVFSFATPVDLGIYNNGNYYKGKIIVLINEETQSIGEFGAMIFRQAPHAKLMGANTAGADGNITGIGLPGGLYAFFSGLGVYYPDGKETQRIGIVPDIVVKQTLAGYQQKKDEQLEKAIGYLQVNH